MRSYDKDRKLHRAQTIPQQLFVLLAYFISSLLEITV